MKTLMTISCFVFLFAQQFSYFNTTNPSGVLEQKKSDLAQENNKSFRLDSIITYDYQTRNPKTKWKYSYNKQNQIIKLSERFLEDNKWHMGDQYDYEYDDSGNVVKELQRTASTPLGSWSIVLQYEYTFKDSLMSKSLRKRFDYETDEFRNDSKEIYSYNNNGILTKTISYYWMSERWKPFYETIDEIADNTKKSASNTFSIMGGEKLPIQRVSYEYNSQNKVTFYAKEQFNENKWIKLLDQSFVYSSENLPKIESVLMYSDSTYGEKTITIDDPAKQCKFRSLYTLAPNNGEWIQKDYKAFHYNPDFPSTSLILPWSDPISEFKIDSILIGKTNQSISGIKKYYWSN